MSPKPSYERINYGLRPAKNMERKMIVEACSRLRSFYSLDTYRYIGLGSPYFSDFSLFHRSLGISQMICIEREVDDAPRFEFNLPFHCIALEFGESHDVLPRLEWAERPSIVWLDYDDPLDERILGDIDVVFSQVASGSLVVVSVRAQSGDFGKTPKDRREKLRLAIGDKIPTGVPLSAFSDASFPKTLWQILDAEIRYAVAERSAGLRDNTKLEYSQIIHFDYRDGVRMLTVGGLICQAGQRVCKLSCDFESLHFGRTGDQAYQIVVPKLTVKELRAIDAQLPASTPALPRVPSVDIRAYAANYRYFPIFTETEL